MFKTFEFHEGDIPHRICGLVVLCGEDLAVIVGGGTKHHVGAASVVAAPQSPISQNGIVIDYEKTISLPNHKESELVYSAANQLSKHLRTTVLVTAGIHIDNASRNDIDVLVNNFQTLIDKIQREMARVL